jgi:iron(III) transport system substrate-binding protein
MNGVLGLGVLCVAVLAVSLEVQAQGLAQTAVEQYYAGLAALPSAERQRKLEDGAGKEGPIILLSTTSGQRGVNQMKMFQTRYPLMKAERGDLRSPDAVERLVAEETAGRHLSDGLSAGIPDMGTIITDMPLVARFPTPATDKVLPQFRGLLDPQNRWVPWFTNEHGISYNTKILKAEDAPKQWMDLCNPKYKGTVSFDPYENVYLSGLYLMLGEEGLKQFLECMGKNEPIIQRGHVPRMTLMLAGDHAIQGDGFLFSGTQLYQKNPDKVPFKAVYEAPVMINAEGFLISKYAPNLNGVALFADFLLSDENQEFMFNENRGTMTRPHAFLPDNVKLIPISVLDKPTRDRLRGYWDQYIGKRR